METSGLILHRFVLQVGVLVGSCVYGGKELLEEKVGALLGKSTDRG